MIETRVTMYDDEKGYINNQRYSVTSIDGPRFLIDDGFEGHPGAGRIFQVTREIGQTEARALEITDEAEKKRLFKAYQKSLEAELSRSNEP